MRSFAALVALAAMLALPASLASESCDATGTLCSYDEHERTGWVCDASSCTSSSYDGRGYRVHAGDATAQVGESDWASTRNERVADACGGGRSQSNVREHGHDAGVSGGGRSVFVGQYDSARSSWTDSCGKNTTYASRTTNVGMLAELPVGRLHAHADEGRYEKDGACESDRAYAVVDHSTMAGSGGTSTTSDLPCGVLP